MNFVENHVIFNGITYSYNCWVFTFPITQDWESSCSWEISPTISIDCKLSIQSTEISSLFSSLAYGPVFSFERQGKAWFYKRSPLILQYYFVFHSLGSSHCFYVSHGDIFIVIFLNLKNFSAGPRSQYSKHGKWWSWKRPFCGHFEPF